MTDELERYLDGESGTEELAPESRAEAQAWDRLFAALRADAPGRAPDWLEGRIMAEVRTHGRAGKESWRTWLTRPRVVRASPLALALPVVALLAIAIGPWLWAPSPGVGGPSPSAAVGADAVVYVQFVFEAPGVRSVAVSGDFSDWDQRHLLEDADGDGVWTGRVPVRPGVHEYMFIVDGETWVTDPMADRYVDDGFGNRNAVLAVAPPGRT